MTVLTMEPLLIRGRLPDPGADTPAPTRGRTTPPGIVEMEPLVIRARPLTNRAAGALREASAAEGSLRFGGFAYSRTAEDDAQARAFAVAAAARRAAAAQDGGPAATAAGPAVDRAAFGGAGYRRTEEDDAQARAHVAADDGAAVAAGRSQAGDASAPTSEPDAPDPAHDDATAQEGTAANGPRRTDGATRSPTGVPGDPSQGAGQTPWTAPGSITTPEGLIDAARAAGDALPHPIGGRATLSQSLTQGPATPSRAVPWLGSGRGYPPPRPVEPIEIDPVPEATGVLSTAMNARLPNLELPALHNRPDGYVPVLPSMADAVAPQELDVEVTLPDVATSDANATEAGRRTSSTRPGRPDPAPTPAAVPVVPPVLLDFRFPEPDPLPAADAALLETQLTRVLALILADLGPRATRVVQEIRDEAFPTLGELYRGDTDPWGEEIRTLLEPQIRQLATAAGVAIDTLQAAVTARKLELANQASHVATAAELEVDQSNTALIRDAERENARTEAAAARERARQVVQFRRARYSHDPSLVESLATARMGFIDADVGRGTTGVDTAKIRRLALIDRYEAAYDTAYVNADNDFQRIGTENPRAPPNENGALWLNVVRDELTTAMASRRTRTENDAAAIANRIREAGLSTKAAVRIWSDTRLRRHLSDAERIARTTTDIDATNASVVAARTAAEQSATRSRLVREIQLATGARLRAMDDAASVTRAHAVVLNDQQLADGRALLAAGEATDPLSGVANTLLHRAAAQAKATRVTALRTLIYAKVPGSERELDDLAETYFHGGSAGLEGRVNRLWTAFEGLGTDVNSVNTELSGLDDHEMALLNTGYQLLKHEVLRARIDSEMSGTEFQRADGLARGGVEGRAAVARAAIADSDHWYSHDSEAALDAVRSLPPGEAAAVVNDAETREHLSSVLAGGTRWVDARGSVTDDRGMRELNLLVAINRPADATNPLDAANRRDQQARADAIDFDRAIRHGTRGDAPSFEVVMDRIRRNVRETAPATWSEAQLDAEVRRRVRAMENAYETEFGAELPTGGVSALRTAVARYSSGTTLDLRQSLLDADRAREGAARFQRTTEGLHTSDSDVNNELKRLYDDALAEVRRNAGRRRAVEARALELMHNDGHNESPPIARVLTAYRTEAEEEAARALSAEWRDRVSRAFGDRYGRRWGGGADPLRDMIESETQFAGETEALARYDTGGGLTPARAVEIAQLGWGTDREMAMSGISGRTREQLGRIAAAYRANTGGGDMLADLRSETGSWTDTTPDTELERDAFDIREAMRGVPTTPTEERDSARRRFAYESTVYFGGSSDRPDAVTAEFATLQRQLDRVEARAREAEAARASGDTERAARLEARLSASRDGVSTAADDYRRAVDVVVEGRAQKIAMGAAIAVMLIAAAITSFVTGGLAAPAWVAVISAMAASAAGTAASMAYKNHALGAAYGQNAMRTDLAVGAVDLIIAALTAGLGDKLLRLPRMAGANALARQATAEAIEVARKSRPMLARLGAFSAENVAQAVPTALTGAALNRDTWRGDPLANFATVAWGASTHSLLIGGVMHAGMRPVIGLVSAGAAGLRQTHFAASLGGGHVTLSSARRSANVGDVEAASSRGGWVERQLAFMDYRERFPDATRAEFEGALRAGSSEAGVRAEAIRAQLPELRSELARSLTGPARELALRARIEVVSDAEFFTRSGSESSGYAVTLNDGGRPVILVREGTPSIRIAAEARHIAQFVDPAHRVRLALLDEGGLRSYSEWTPQRRIEAWQAKLDLEIEAQRADIPDFEAALRDPNLSAQRAAELRAMLDEARSALDVLSRRRGELDGLTPADVARITTGEAEGPAYLHEEPRLFGKAKSPPMVAETYTENGRVYEAEAPERVGGRWARWTAVRVDGEVTEMVLQRWRDGAWRLSGRVGRERGGIAEFGARVEHARWALAQESATVAVRQLGAQKGTGAGLDDLWFRFEVVGGVMTCRASVYEVKNYDGTVSSFSAIEENFRANVELATRRLREIQARATSRGDDTAYEEAGMTRAQVTAAIEALRTRQVDIIVRTTQSTSVDPRDLARLQNRANRGRKGAPVRVTHDPRRVSEEALDEGSELWIDAEQFRSRGADDPDNATFKNLSNGPQGQTQESITTARAVVRARQSPGSPIEGEVRWALGRRYLVDSNGRPVQVVHEGPGTGAFDADAEATRLVALAQATVEAADGKRVGDVRVVVNVDAMVGRRAEELRAAVERAATTGVAARAAASRIVFTPTYRHPQGGAVVPFVAPAAPTKKGT